MLFLLARLVVGRHLHQPHLPLSKEEYVISKLHFFFTSTIYGAFLQLTAYACLFISFFFLSFFFFFFFFLFFLSSLSIRKKLLPLAPYCLMSLSSRYIPFFCMHLHRHVLPCAFSFFFMFIYSMLPCASSAPTLFLPLFF